ncbi:MAG: hypothetical protein SOX72_00535 [Oscillospiraceae bacterium]|nr:hypothetical protein [Oscillospiraceae bacterium]MDY4190690.1 hypothetical protein [Oscillospiraceae bacterium]
MNLKKKRVWIYLALTLALILYVLVKSVNLNPLYLDGALFWAFTITVYTLVWVLTGMGGVRMVQDELHRGVFELVPGGKFPKQAKWIIGIPWAAIAVTVIGSSVFFNCSAYRSQIGESEIRKFSEEVQAIDISQVPVVDEQLARKLADKKLGERPSMGSQVVLGEPTIQMVDGKLQWVVPLHHSGFFKWLTNLEGTPGYITVSATNVKDVEYVDGKYLKYQPGAYFFQNLTRYTRFGAALFTGIVDYSFELDDSGEPYWVISTYKNLRGFSLPEATGVVLVHATTGETQKYAIENVPSWVDRVQPESFVMQQINNRGEYINGFLNWANKDKFRTSEGEIIVYNNGQCYLFTGLTSVGSDESAIGFIMVNMVTKDSFQYQMAGATESAAQSSAQGKVQHLKYTASFPLILNVNSEPTYFMTLKDYEGLIKQYAMVSVTDYSVVGTGETIQAALRDYEQAIKNTGAQPNLDQSAEKKSVTGTVERIAAEYNGDSTDYRMILSEYPNLIFNANSQLSPELALTVPGDRVTLEYFAEDIRVTKEVGTFDNLMYQQK